MERNTLALFLTFLLGLFIVVGAVLAFFFQKKNQVLDFIFGLAFSILAMLIVFDLLPEAIELLHLSYLWLFLLCLFLGIFLFKILDHFIPEHHDHHKEGSIAHIGVITTIALILHNIIEGMAIYLTASSNLSLGLMMSLGVGFHNLPLGMVISSTFYHAEEKHKRTFVYLFLLTISTFIGGMIPFFIPFQGENELLIGSLLTLTLGMLVYIAFFELFPRIRKTKNKKVTAYGILLGVLILLGTIFFK